jgi:hypothetical protein
MAAAGRLSAIPRNLRATLETAAVTGGSLDWIEEIYFGEEEPSTEATRPYLWVHLDQPPITEKWTGARNQKDVEVRAVVEVQVDHQDLDEPYGVGGASPKMGVLTAVEEVMNAIDAGGLGVGSDAKPAAYDFNQELRSVRKIADDTWKAEVVVIAKVRFISGDR